MTVSYPTLSELTLLAPEIWLTVSICVLLMVDFLFPRLSQKHLAALSMGTTGLIIGNLLMLAYRGIEGTLFNTMFILDSTAIFFKVFILAATLLVILASTDYVRKIAYFRGEYYILLLLSALGMMLMVSANDFLSLFISVEFTALWFYILVAYLKEDAKSNEAGIKLFILSVLSAAILAYGASLIYVETGTILFDEIVKRPSQSLQGFGMTVGLLLIFISIAFKMGAVPFHAWIPDVYEGAPTPITAHLSIVPKAATFAVALRLLFMVFAEIDMQWPWMVTAISLVSMTYGNITAFTQKDIKRLLAYSGIAQIGTLLIGVATGTKMGNDAILFYFIAYLFANIGAFVVVLIYTHQEPSGDYNIDHFAGLNRRSPLLAASMLVFLLSLAGVPPLAGFVSKLYIFAAAIRQGLMVLVAVGLINVVIAFYYYLVVLKKIYVLEPKAPAIGGTYAAVPISMPMKIALYTCLAGVLVLGIFPRPFIELSEAATRAVTSVAAR